MVCLGDGKNYFLENFLYLMWYFGLDFGIKKILEEMLVKFELSV